jgi:hypothetical protein
MGKAWLALADKDVLHGNSLGKEQREVGESEAIGCDSGLI